LFFTATGEPVKVGGEIPFKGLGVTTECVCTNARQVCTNARQVCTNAGQVCTNAGQETIKSPAAKPPPVQSVIPDLCLLIPDP
jgi:hypothetical protein